ncbi:MAG: acyl-CoA dehydrogenase C-terminal domain-containing protein, partial [Alphaproteobacteria bacterium]|nr:acyl-CoA dehydrogenase C-terminal domain-containing protein [Alphaproteobacteria bacterium]
AAARAICLMTAHAIDLSRRAEDAETRERAAARASLLTPVAKAFATDIANEVTSLGVQVHGGAGYIEETGAAQLYRDARILAIYEGTNGIQAIDLVHRKLPLLSGEAVAHEIADMQGVIAELVANQSAPFGHTELNLVSAVESFARATEFLHEMAVLKPAAALAGATAYLRLFALARAGTALARGALAAARLGAAGHSDRSLQGHIVTARFFAEHVATAAGGLELSILNGAGSVEAGLSWLSA